MFIFVNKQGKHEDNDWWTERSKSDRVTMIEIAHHLKESKIVTHYHVYTLHFDPIFKHVLDYINQKDAEATNNVNYEK